ncbi:MAG: ketopantoate reductase family protein [Deltaproteobacteria bacterium]|nr:ketopantoate reductase family protein [Deltaproteobacteria bacterium]
MRFIIYGAGAIGGTIGARLFQHGENVVLIARGPHLQAMQDHGLLFKSPHETVTLDIPCVGHPSEITFNQDDVVFMTMKSQHTLEALEALRDMAGEDIPVICCQNGVANERMALRRFNRVYGMVVMLPASHMEPGVVQSESKATTGILDAGCFPSGTDSVIEEVTATLSASGFSSNPDPSIMRWKYAKLLMNLNNSIQALCEPQGREALDIMRMMAKEAMDCYQAAGIECASREEFMDRRGDHIQLGEVEGSKRGGGSSWQSIFRGTGDIEADYLNGEIVLLGKLHGVDTPANRVMQQLANRLAREGGKPGSYPVDQIRVAIVEAGGEFK